MRKYFLILIVTAGCIGSMVACKKDKVPVVPIVVSDCPDTISFSTQIEPIMVANCSVSGCHGGGSTSGGYNLEGYANISANANTILTVIKHEGGLAPMPQGGNKLADSLIQQFKCWKDQGTLNN